MGITTFFKISILSAFLITLTACGGSNQVYEGQSGVTGAPENTTDLASTSGTTDTTVGTTEATDGNTNAINGTSDGAVDVTADTTNTTGDTANATGGVTVAVLPPHDFSQISARQQIVTGDCGSLAVSDALQSNLEQAPTPMITGQLVKGSIDPNSSNNTEHWWSIALQSGDYHIVLDTMRADREFGELGLAIRDTTDTRSHYKPVISSNESNYRSRSHAFFEITEPRTAIMRVRPNNTGAEDYVFGIFENGSAVPSPYFTDCPQVQSLSVDTTAALILPESFSLADDRWYRVDLAVGDYIMNSLASRTDGTASPVQYTFSYADHFGQVERFEQSDYTDKIGPSITDSLPVKNTELRPVWLRIQNFNCELNMEFTLNTDL